MQECKTQYILFVVPSSHVAFSKFFCECFNILGHRQCTQSLSYNSYLYTILLLFGQTHVYDTLHLASRFLRGKTLTSTSCVSMRSHLSTPFADGMTNGMCSEAATGR